jgi:putative DNA primase/helicase
VARFAIQGNVPLFSVDATTRGSGKGLLIDVFSAIATGRHAPRYAQTTDEEEERKRLFTIALAGDVLVHIDNIVAPFGSGALDSVLTGPTIRDRVLGVNAEREAPISTVFFASGNNMVYKGDLARRVVPINLDPKCERPEERTGWQHSPLIPWVIQKRPRLVVAALTILKGYFTAGKPDQKLTAMGSFEEWSDLIRSTIVWTGEPDPCEGRKDIEADSDPAYEALHNFLTAWYARYGANARTVNELKHDLDAHTTYDSDAKRVVVHYEWKDLHDAVNSMDKYAREVNVEIIGKALRSWKGRMVNGLRLVTAGEDSHNKRKRWKVVSAGDAGDCGG